MKRIACYLVLTVIVAFSIPNHANAQFWKSWFEKKETRKRKYKPVQHKSAEENTVPKATPFKKKLEVQYPTTVKKKTYRVDVLVPLYVDELEKSDKKFPDKAITGVDFYEGIKLAIDTLNSFHYNIQVYVHDIGAPASSVAALIKNHKLDSSDLIIGALQTSEVFPVAEYTKKKKINFISALSPADAGVKDDPFFIMPQATLQMHCNYLMEFIQKKHPKKKMVLLYRTNSIGEQNAFNYITDNDEPSAFSKLLCNAMPQQAQLAALLDSTHTNIIVMPILDNNYADNLLKQLYVWFPSYDFEVYGMPSWKTLQGLKKADTYPNLTIYFTYPFYMEQSSAASQNVDRKYRKEYGGKPGELVYRAYEALYWSAYMLNEYGTIFNNRFSDKSACLFTKFDIQPSFDKDGNFLYNENQHLYLYKYQSSSFIVDK